MDRSGIKKWNRKQVGVYTEFLIGSVYIISFFLSKYKNLNNLTIFLFAMVLRKNLGK